MTNAPAGTSAPAIDTDALARWMDRAGLPGPGLPVEARFVSGGSQNEIFEIRRGELRGALRKPPANAPPARDDGILREWLIIAALSGTDVPHAAAIAVCADSTPLGRPFYLMDFVEGWSPIAERTWPAPFDADVEARAGLAYELVEGVVRLGAVDWRAKGLADLGRPDGYHDRQVERWTRFFERIKGRDLPGLDEATRWLTDHRPLDFVPGIMHGDYQFANVMFEHGAPARLAAIVDWEMGTIGDPKLDLAWSLQGWPEDTLAETSAIGYVDIAGLPGRSALVDHYAHQSGRQVDDFDYYLVLARWKLAIVLEQGYQRAGDDEKLLGFGPTVVDLMRRAADLAESSTYRGRG
jgi:aminoglycoside phosphotransferase (APT) family kinase protein